MYAWWELYKHLKTEEWERANSSLGRINKSASFEECRDFSRTDIANGTTLSLDPSQKFIELPKETEFHFIGRVNTNNVGSSPDWYFNSFRHRDYISFSSFSNKNISRYKDLPIFIYNLNPEDIVHVFPMDSDIYTKAENETDLCGWPSTWLSLNDLEKIKNELRTYDQITCKTKRNDEIIMPIAVASFNEADDQIMKLAEEFSIPYLLAHADHDAINRTGDLLYDYGNLHYNVAPKLGEHFPDIDVSCMAYFD